MFWKCNFKGKQNERVSDVFRQMENAIFFHSLKTEEKEATANETFFSPHAKEAQKLRSAKTFSSVPSLSLLHALTHTRTHTLSRCQSITLSLLNAYISLSLNNILKHTLALCLSTSLSIFRSLSLKHTHIFLPFLPTPAFSSESSAYSVAALQFI